MNKNIWTLALIVSLGSVRCSTTQVAPPAPPVPPSYISVPHPRGMDTGDLSAIFLDETAPLASKNKDFAKTCDSSFQRLKQISSSREEVDRGLVELLRRDPVHYHWCFYSKMQFLEEEMKKDSYIDEKQRVVLDFFDFLTPVSRAFAQEFHDSRYLRWAVVKYKNLSEWIFYRKLDLTPAGTEELVQASNPFGLWRESGGKAPILEKYHIVEGGTPVVKTLAPREPGTPTKLPAKPLASVPAKAVKPVLKSKPIAAGQPLTGVKTQ